MIEGTDTPGTESVFMQTHIPLLLDRYRLCYTTELNCAEYFVLDRSTQDPISFALILSLNLFSKQIAVVRFWPELYKQQESKHLSAACFYLLVHHFARCHGLDQSYSIFLQTTAEVFEKFYLRLKDFDFRIKRFCVGNAVDVWSRFLPTRIDTSMVEKRIGEVGEIPFGI